MRPPQHAVVPERISALSLSRLELVVPEPEALEAVDIAEARGVLILAWEGWVKGSDGRVGHGSAPQGTASLSRLAVSEAAALCRETIAGAARVWREENPDTQDQLHFCLTFRVS